MLRVWLRHTGGEYTWIFRCDIGTGDNTNKIEPNVLLGGAPTNGVWYTIRCSVDNSAQTGKIFIDGVDATTAVLTNGGVANINNEDAPFLVGAYMNSGAATGFLDGVIDAVVVAATYTATASEPLNTQPATDYLTGMAGLWNFNASSYADSMPAGNALTGVNAPTFVDGYPFQL